MKVIGSWNEFLKTTKGVFNKAGNFAGDGNVMKDAAEAWKQYKGSVNTSNLPAIGRLPQTKHLIGKPGYNILNSNRWNLNVNDAWLQGAIDSGKDVHLVTKPTHVNLWDKTNNRWSVFKREMNILEKAGYKLKGNMMVHPNNQKKSKIRCG